MATWREMSRECLQVAQQSFHDGRLRRSISSAYYAAYGAVTSRLVDQKVNFAHGWNNPAHDQLPDLILNNLSLPKSARYRLNKAIRILRRAREDADYRPGASIDQALARDCLRNATRIIEALEE